MLRYAVGKTRAGKLIPRVAVALERQFLAVGFRRD